MKEFNLNSYVGVKLTDEGLKILKHQHKELLKGQNPAVRKLIGDFEAPHIDEDGYSQLTVGELMQHFGSYIYNGNPKPPFDMNIKIPDKSLTEYAKTKTKCR